MASTKHHMAVSVRGVLHKSDAEIRNDHLEWMLQDNGEPFASVADLRSALMDELAAGNELLPLGECDNFDPKTGCKGHRKEGE